MPKRFDLLVFDWDGTLMDSAGTIVSSIQNACRDLDLPVPSDAASRHVIGLGLQEAMEMLVPARSTDDYQRLVERYRFYYLGQDSQIPLFEGVAQAIADMRDAGFLLAVATGKSRQGLSRALEHSGLGAYFHSTRCADECFSKPHPCMIDQIMDELGVAQARTVMIGDTSHDLQMAVNAGVDALGASYGAHPKANLEALSPLICVDSFVELNKWIIENA
jgi:phosphoglycolate phosphatase